MNGNILMTANPVPNLSENLMLHLLLNNNENDVTSTVEPTAAGAPLFDGEQVYFDGTDESVDIPSMGGYNEWTISTWWKDDGTTSYGHLFTSTTQNNFALKYYATNDNFYVYTSTAGSLYTPIGSALTGVLYHVVVTCDGTTLKIYINKELLLETPFAEDLPLSAYILGNGYLSEYTKAYQSNLRVYNIAQSLLYITALYDEGAYPKPLPLPTTNGLIAYYPLTGTTEDETGNYDALEVSRPYVDDAEKGAVLSSGGATSSITPNTTAITLYNMTDFTVSFWIQFSAATLSLIHTGGVGCQGNNYSASGQGVGVQFRFDGTYKDMYFHIGNGGGTLGGYTFPVKPTTSDWYHIVYHYSTTAVGKSFINGVLNSTGSVFYTFPSNAYAFMLGGWETFSTSYAEEVKVQNVRVYNRQITDTEAIDIYNYENNFRPIDIDEGLYHYHKLHNNSNDHYYNQKDGTDTGDVTYDGLSVTYANSGWSDIGTIAYLGSQSLIFTMSVWFYVGDSGTVVVSTERSGTNVGDAAMYITDTNATFQINRGSDPYGYSYTINHTASINKWHHFFLEKNGNTDVTLWLDNELMGSVTSGWSFNATVSAYSNFELNRRRNYTYSTAYYDGQYSHLRMYNKKLTDTQRKAIYESNKGEFV